MRALASLVEVIRPILQCVAKRLPIGRQGIATVWQEVGKGFPIGFRQGFNRFSTVVYWFFTGFSLVFTALLTTVKRAHCNATTVFPPLHCCGSSAHLLAEVTVASDAGRRQAGLSSNASAIIDVL